MNKPSDDSSEPKSFQPVTGTVTEHVCTYMNILLTVLKRSRRAKATQENSQLFNEVMCLETEAFLFLHLFIKTLLSNCRTAGTGCNTQKDHM